MAGLKEGDTFAVKFAAKVDCNLEWAMYANTEEMAERSNEEILEKGFKAIGKDGKGNCFQCWQSYSTSRLQVQELALRAFWPFLFITNNSRNLSDPSIRTSVL